MKTIPLIILILAMSCAGQVLRVPSAFKDGIKWQLDEDAAARKTYEEPTLTARTHSQGHATHFGHNVHQQPFHGRTITEHGYSRPTYLTHTVQQPVYSHPHHFGTVGEVNIAETKLANEAELTQFPHKTPKHHITDVHIPLQKSPYQKIEPAKTYLPARWR